jgi:hypothetical protein
MKTDLGIWLLRIAFAGLIVMAGTFLSTRDTFMAVYSTLYAVLGASIVTVFWWRGIFEADRGGDE